MSSWGSDWWGDLLWPPAAGWQAPDGRAGLWQEGFVTGGRPSCSGFSLGPGLAGPCHSLLQGIASLSGGLRISQAAWHGGRLTSSSQELRSLPRPQPSPVPCEAMKLRSRSISSDRRACSSWEAQAVSAGRTATAPPTTGRAHLVVAQQLLALLLAASQRVLPLLSLPGQGPDLQALLRVLLRQHLQLPLQRRHVRPVPGAEEGTDGVRLGSGETQSSSGLHVPRSGFAFSLLRGWELVTGSLGSRCPLHKVGVKPQRPLQP